MKLRHLFLFIVLFLFIGSSIHSQNIYNLKMKAKALYNQQKYHESILYYKRALWLDTNDINIYYNIASCYSLANMIDESYNYILLSIYHGYYNINWLKKDNDFDYIKNDSRWDTVISKCSNNFDNYILSINRELYNMYLEDQAARSGGYKNINWNELGRNDILRRERVKQLFIQGKINAPDDYYHAAMIFQHGIDSSDYLKAYLLATAAVDLKSRNPHAKWLKAATKDRYLLSIGKKQIYGTQYLRYPNGILELSLFDTSVVTDDERNEHGVFSLNDLYNNLAKRNKPNKK